VVLGSCPRPSFGGRFDQFLGIPRGDREPATGALPGKRLLSAGPPARGAIGRIDAPDDRPVFAGEIARTVGHRPWAWRVWVIFFFGRGSPAGEVVWSAVGFTVPGLGGRVSGTESGRTARG